MLISEEYRSLNAEMHRTNKHFGMESHKYAARILKTAELFACKDILDYGCGKGSLTLSEIPIHRYDPAIPEISETPKPADLVVCTDVMEHIEPDCLDGVLKDILRCMKKAGYFVITTQLAHKLLPDGSNPHRIVKPALWWHEKLLGVFEVLQIVAGMPAQKRYEFIVSPK